MKQRRWFIIVPLLTVLLCIVCLSSQSYSQQTIRPWLTSGNMEEWLIRVLRNVRFIYDGQEVSVRSMGGSNAAEFMLRKLAHMVLYGSLSFTMLMAAWVLMPWRKGVSVAVTLGLALLLALADEFNQQFSVERTASLADVGIDMVGAALGVILFLIGSLLYTQRQERLAYKANSRRRLMRIFYGMDDTNRIERERDRHKRQGGI